ncbi:MAG: IS1595 family transposase [Bacteroidia bacterium]|nr:IS1595 family transposase [Bacteroidia bacterium]
MYFLSNAKRGVSSHQMAKFIGVRQPTVWFMMHRLRESSKDANYLILEGEVESDETFVGPNISRDTRLQKAQKEHFEEQERIYGLSKKKKRTMRGFPAKRGRKLGSTKEVLEQKKKEQETKGKRKPFDKHRVVVGFSERNGRIVLRKLGDRSSLTKENVSRELLNYVSTKSILFTDEASVYTEVGAQFADHKSVNHEETYVKGKTHINNIENVWNHYKRTIDGTYFHYSNQHFNRYLDEFVFRWNSRNESEQSIFNSLLSMSFGKRLDYKTLIKDSPPKSRPKRKKAA